MRISIWLLTGLVVLDACSHRREATCPPMDALARRDAKADAVLAAAHGDNRLVMLGGYVGELPGGLEPGQVRVLEGTSDTTIAACAKKRRIAFRYARTYNRTILTHQVQPH